MAERAGRVKLQRKIIRLIPGIFFNKFHHKSNTPPALAKQQITVFHNQFAKNWI